MPIITLLGLLTTVFLLTVWVEVVPSLPAGRAARFLDESLQPAAPPIPAWRSVLMFFDRFTGRWTPAAWLRQAQGDLYFAHLTGRWQDWDAVQFTSLRLAAGAGALLAGLVIYDNWLLAIVTALLGWQIPVILLGSISRRVRRQFQAQLPEFIQLTAAQMAAGVSLEEALRRVAKSSSLPAAWMRRVQQRSQGRVIYEQLHQEAQASALPELIGLAVQLEFVRMGTAQQELMAQMATRIASEYSAAADQRAERVGAELVIPMVVFYFLPFIAIILSLIGYPILATL